MLGPFRPDDIQDLQQERLVTATNLGSDTFVDCFAVLFNVRSHDLGHDGLITNNAACQEQFVCCGERKRNKRQNKNKQNRESHSYLVRHRSRQRCLTRIHKKTPTRSKTGTCFKNRGNTRNCEMFMFDLTHVNSDFCTYKRP